MAVMQTSNRIVGRILRPCEELYVEWNVENYFSIPQKRNNFVSSPIFHFSNASWFLRIYPNGERENGAVEWTSFYLGRLDSKTEKLPVTYSLGIIYGDGQLYKKSCTFNIDDNDFMYGWPRFIGRSELQRNKENMVPEGTLRVFCRVEHSCSVAEAASQTVSVAEAASQTVSVDDSDTLSQDYCSLFHSERKSDVTVKVKSRLFRVHKLILGTRSSVFAAMFEHDMKENSSGVVDIADCEPDIFHDFLSFVYTGKIENLSSENVQGLFSLADKYDLQYLKSICIDFMKDNLLCLDRVCEVVAIADRHNEAELKKFAVEFIGKNIKTIIPTEQWISFMAENPVLAAELLMTVISD